MTAGTLRIYTINEGMMDSWVATFKECVEPMAEFGLKVEASWVTAVQTQFVWIRSGGDSMAEYEEIEAAFYASDWFTE